MALTTAVIEFIAHYKARNSSVSTKAVFDRFVESKQAASDKYWQELSSTFNRLSSLHQTLVCELTPQEIEAASGAFPPAYRNAALRYVRAAYNFAIRSGWLKENPVSRLQFTKIVRDSVEVIPPATAWQSCST